MLAAIAACLPLVALVSYAAVDRYYADRSRAEVGSANRAELFAALIGESSPTRPPSSKRLDQLLHLSPLPAGTALVVLRGETVVARSGPVSAGPLPSSKTAPVIAERRGTFYATGSDGIQRVWGLAPVAGGPLTVAYGRPGASIYGPARTALYRDLALAAAATLLAVLGAFFLCGRVTAPLRRLSKRVGSYGANELGAIERGFQTLDDAVAVREAELARRAERLATLRSIDKAILDAQTPQEVAEAALGRLLALVGAARSSIVLFDLERSRAQTLAVATGAETMLPSGSEYVLAEELFPIDELQAGRPVTHEDITDIDSSSELLSALRADGIRSYTALPLIAHRELLGSVTIGFKEPGPLDDEPLAVAAEVADQLAIALQHSRLHAELQAVLDAALDAIVVLDSNRRLLAANQAATSILGRTRAELFHASVDENLLEGLDDTRWQSFMDAGSFEDVFTIERADGLREVEGRGLAEFLPGRHLLFLRDVTDRSLLESQLRQAQKMEAIGQFAGGVAHDFNNLLTAISGFGAIAQRKVRGGPGATEIEQVERAADRAARLTNQLLAFARQKVVQPTVLDLGETVAGVVPMLSRLIGDDVECVVVTDDTASILADRGQIEQVLVNLAVNARDAMPGGGTLTIETRNETINARYAAAHPGVVPGSYVCLTVTDTGWGIDQETQQHLFEPFFTTKEQGRGTGLGLATVHGIVTQAGGHVTVYSEPQLGTTFKVYLPVTRRAADSAVPEEPASLDSLGGTETILLCEDDELVSLYIQEILGELGYTVLTASRPSEAIDIAAAYRERKIALFLTDIVMPEMSGTELAARLKERDPELKVIFLSGYSAETVRQRGALPPDSAFIEKPFDEVALARTIRGLLGRPSGLASADSLPTRAS